MLPKFPKFKKLELSDRKAIEKISIQQAPYSDFNFESLWAWDIKEKMKVSSLHGNLVLMFADYITGEPFYSFLGNHKVDSTVNSLLELSIEEGLRPALSLVPEDSLTGIDLKKFSIEPDQSNFDYIFDLSLIAAYPGSKFESKRTMVNRFLRNFPDPEVRVLNRATDLENINQLNELWNKNKTVTDGSFEIQKETIAIQRFLDTHFDDALAVGVFVKKKLIGYSIFTLLKNKYSIGHFSKAAISYAGVYEFLMRESAKILIQYKYQYLNYEQDLGLPGLRRSKGSYRPISFLKKYIVKYG
jgi:uncharacterized protein